MKKGGSRKIETENDQAIETLQCSACGHDVQAGKDRCIYCGAHQEGIAKSKEGAEGDADLEDPMNPPGDAMPWQFALEKGKRRKPLSLLTQIIIFFAGFALMGFIILLLS